MFDLRFMCEDMDFMPTAAREGDAGYDLRAFIRPEDTAHDLVPTFLDFYSEFEESEDNCPALIVNGEVVISKIAMNELRKEGVEALESCFQQAIANAAKSYAKKREASPTQSNCVVLWPKPYANESKNRPSSKLIYAGFSIQLPDHTHPNKNYVMKVVSRSGLAARHQICVANSPGIVDSGYRGDVKICLENRGSNLHLITHGMRCAQALFEECLKLPKFDELKIVDALDDSERGAGGFGHSGT
jgi:deoxyuridine 5'-triphosphate nucleotidohydrolase